MAEGLAKFVGETGREAVAAQDFVSERCEPEISAAKQFESHSIEEGIKNVNAV